MLSVHSTIKFLTVCICALGLVGCASSYDNITFDDVYGAAKAGDKEYLMELKAEGVPMNLTNEDGDTPLCVALKNKDKTAYDILRSVGASKSIRCRVIGSDSTSSLPADYAYGSTNSDLLLYTPDHNPPQKQYPKTTNNSVITNTVLAVGFVVGIIVVVALF